ncbi:MFS transporter [Hydrogenophaga sp. 5NK40-0174]|uniref:MFS transporter n=1 Tax=Hydrogenophaga sp. 5NK40-0174 TaxID=3127649 RepID=UPI0031087BCC
MTQHSSESLSVGTRISYGAGNIGLQFLVAGMSFFLMIFYTDVALVPPAIAGAALLVGKIWDTINDPLFGWLADRTQSRHGRRRVYLIYGAVPLALAAAAIWWMPAGMSPLWAFVWIMLSYALYDTMLTVVQLPYTALSAELTSDYDERTRLVSYSSAGALVGYVLGSVLLPKVAAQFTDERTGFIVAGSLAGLVAGLSIGVVAWRIRERPKDTPESKTADRESAADTPVLQSMRLVARNRPFLLLSFGAGLVRLGLTLVQTALAYFVVYQMQGTKADMPRYLGIMLLVVAISLPIWKIVVQRWEKNLAYVVGLCCSAAGLMLLYGTTEGATLRLYAVLVLFGIGMGAHWIAPYAMVPDAVDHGNIRDKSNITGIYFGVYGLIDKIARTIGTAIVPWVLAGTGYVANTAQTEHALEGIRWNASVLPVLCFCLALPLLWRYPITRASHQRLMDRS